MVLWGVVVVKQPWECALCKVVTFVWGSKCPRCGQPRTLSPHVFPAQRLGKSLKPIGFSAPEDPRISLGHPLLDTFLGGGLPRRMTTVLYGKPGCGKSTLSLQIACQAGLHGRALYITGEEKTANLDARARRCGFSLPPTLQCMESDDTDAALYAVRHTRPTLVVLDSLQTIHSRRVTHKQEGQAPRMFEAGTPEQNLHVYRAFTALMKDYDFACVIVSHVNNRGEVNATMKWVHELNSVLVHMRAPGDVEDPLRLLRVVKTRSGRQGVLDVAMTPYGLVPLSEADADAERRAMRRRREARRARERAAQEDYQTLEPSAS